MVFPCLRVLTVAIYDFDSWNIEGKLPYISIPNTVDNFLNFFNNTKSYFKVVKLYLVTV